MHLSSRPGQAYATIADALKDAAATGDTLLLGEGNYDEALVLTTSIVIRPAEEGEKGQPLYVSVSVPVFVFVSVSVSVSVFVFGRRRLE